MMVVKGILSAGTRTVELGGAIAFLSSGHWIPVVLVFGLVTLPRIIIAISELQKSIGFRAYLESLGKAAVTQAEYGNSGNLNRPLSEILDLTSVKLDSFREPVIPVDPQLENIIQKCIREP